MEQRDYILVVDDSSDDVFILKRALLHAGIECHVMVVRDGEEAVDYLAGTHDFTDRSKYPLPRILILDLKLPRMDGFDVLDWLQRQPKLKRMVVTVLTSSSEPKDVDRAYDLGANSYLVKPNTFDAYMELLKALHGYWLKFNLYPECNLKIRSS